MFKLFIIVVFCYLGTLPITNSEQGACPKHSEDKVSCARKFSLDDQEPEHTVEYYLDRPVDWIQQHMYNDLMHMAPIVNEAKRQAMKAGLIVPAILYIDAEEFVRAKWGRVLCALDLLSPKDNKRNWALMAMEVYGFTHMLNRVRDERTDVPIIPATGNEEQLFAQLIATQKNISTLNDFVIDKSNKNGNLFLEKFHAELKEWNELEFPKLNKEIEQITDDQQRLNNIKVLWEDLKLVTSPPW